jgi:hypothetical protein
VIGKRAGRKKRDLAETVLASISAVKPNMPGQRCVHAALLDRRRGDIFAPEAAGKAFSGEVDFRFAAENA